MINVIFRAVGGRAQQTPHFNIHSHILSYWRKNYQYTGKINDIFFYFNDSIIQNDLFTCVSAQWRSCSATRSCPTLCNLMICSPPGSSVYGIFPARILERVAISSSRGSSQPRDRTHVSCISTLAGVFFTTEPLGSPQWRSDAIKNLICFRLLFKIHIAYLRKHLHPSYFHTYTLKIQKIILIPLTMVIQKTSLGPLWKSTYLH